VEYEEYEKFDGGGLEVSNKKNHRFEVGRGGGDTK
jgi:hypothetical protein